MGLFLQYSVEELWKYAKSFLESISEIIDFDQLIGNTQLELTKEEIDEIYSNIKSYETEKTQNNFLLILKRSFFNNKKTKNKKIIYILKNIARIALIINDDKIIKEILQWDLYNAHEVYKEECNILYSWRLSQEKPIELDYTTFRNQLKKKIRENFQSFESDKIQKSLNNAIKKINLPIRSWKGVGILEISDLRKNSPITIDYYNLSWQVFGFFLTSSSKTKKIGIDSINEENFPFLKCFLIDPYSINKKLEFLKEKNIIKIETSAGLNQIHLNYQGDLTGFFNEIKDQFENEY